MQPMAMDNVVVPWDRVARSAAVAVVPKSSLRCCPAYGFPFAHVASARSRQLSTGDVGRPGGSAAGDILGPTGLVPTRPNLRIRRGTTASADSVSRAGGSDGVGDTHDGRRRTSRCLGGEEVWPYAGAQQVARLRYLSGMEAVWGMYATEPFRNVGWWIAVAWHADGTVTDPITGSVPTMQPPSANGTGSRLRWMAMSDAPFISSDEDGRWGVQDLYRNFLLEHRNQEGASKIHRLALVWVHEPLTPFEVPARRDPALILTWPKDRVSATDVEGVLGVAMHTPVYDKDTGSLQATFSLSAQRQLLP